MNILPPFPFHSNPLQLAIQRTLQPSLDGIEVLGGINPSAPIGLTLCQRKVFGHDTVLIDSIDASLFEGFGEGDYFGGFVEFSTLD